MDIENSTYTEIFIKKRVAFLILTVFISVSMVLNEINFCFNIIRHFSQIVLFVPGTPCVKKSFQKSRLVYTIIFLSS